MDALSGTQRRFPAVVIVIVLLILCIIPGQFWAAKQFPTISGPAQINTSLVFLDIPIHLPVVIDLILAPALFFLVYPFVILLYPSRQGMFSWRHAVQRVRAAFVGLFILLCCTLSGGLIYYLVRNNLTTQVRNGINSLGINADIHLAYPGHETITLRGSLILFVCFVIGMFIFIRKIRKEPPHLLTREQRMTPYERMLQEKRMKEKQVKIERQQPQTIQPDYTTGKPSGLCYNQPVLYFRPEARYYMPV